MFGLGGTFFIWKFVGPILSTQDEHRRQQTIELAELRSRMDASERERELLKEMVTQRAQVDDLRQYVRIAADENRVATRLAMDLSDKHHRDSADQHQSQLLVMKELVATLKGIEYRLGVAPDRRGGEVE